MESVKAASDVYAPITGTVKATNAALSDNPALVNASAEKDAWFVQMEVRIFLRVVRAVRQCEESYSLEVRAHYMLGLFVDVFSFWTRCVPLLSVV